MPHPPPVHYVRSTAGDLAYQVIGDGPIDFIVVPSWVGNIELLWELPETARFFDRLTAFTRLIIFDKRGTGQSERGRVATLEERADDITSIMNATDSARAAVAGWADSAGIAATFAATHPERVEALVLGTFAPHGQHSEGSDTSISPEIVESVARSIEEGWGEGRLVPLIAPSRANDERFINWFGRWERLSATPSGAAEEFRWTQSLDLRAILPTIRVPTLVIHRRDAVLVRREVVRAAAGLIPGARYVELPGVDAIPVVGDADEIVAVIQEFLTGRRALVDAERVLATVLFTDIVGSTERASQLGDREWTDLLAAHDAALRQRVDEYGGREIDTAGDGFFATFDGPARAVRSACAARDDVRNLGLQIRAGLHTGEVEWRDRNVTGLAVHVGARVAALAQPSEVLVTSTVKELVLGSGLEFVDRGTHTLKGVPDRWRLYAVTS